MNETVNLAAEAPATDRDTRHDIEIRDLYKIFGPQADRHIAAVKGGMSKDELNNTHNHVLGLQDITLTIPQGRITVIMGLSGSGKSTLIRQVRR